MRKSMPDISKDKLVMSKDITIKYDTPALNFKTGGLDNFSLLHYEAELYKRNDESLYYIFVKKPDCTMYIMNCNGDVYKEIQKVIKLNDEIEIWQKTDDGKIGFIPTSYRHLEGIGGFTIIIE